MFVILVYDIGVKRVSKVLKTCRKYLLHIQKSVFEGKISQKKLDQLMKELENLIEPEEDSVVIYCFDSLKFASKKSIGCQEVDRDIL